MQFNLFFTIEVLHDYFSGRHSEALLMEPTAACASLLKKHRLLFQPKGGGTFAILSVLAGKDDAFTEPNPKTAFDFFLLMDDSKFLHCTSVPEKKTDEVILFSNVDAKGKSTLQLIATAIPKPPVYVTGSKLLVGIIRIFHNQTVPAHFTLSLKAAEVKWKYYLIANRNLTNLTIEDKTSGIVFSKKNAANGSPPKDQISESIRNNFPDAGLFVFESNEPIPCQQLGRKDIQLISNNAVLINHLPNPGLSDNGIKIINTIT